MNDIQQLPTPIPRALNLSSKGTKHLKSVIFKNHLKKIFIKAMVNYDEICLIFKHPKKTMAIPRYNVEELIILII